MENNTVVEFDETDWPIVSAYKWHPYKDANTTYARAHIRVKGRRHTLQMHSLLMQPSVGETVDHIDQDGLNNHRSNLRICSQAQNCRNRRVSQTKKLSQYKGVFRTTDKTWMAVVTADKQRHYLGCYAEEVEAAHAYNLGAGQLHGEYAGLNVLPEEYDQSRVPIPTTKRKHGSYTGVSLYKSTGRWYGRVTVVGKTHCTSYYATEVEAALAYNRLAFQLLGNKAKLNHIEGDSIA